MKLFLLYTDSKFRLISGNAADFTFLNSNNDLIIKDCRAETPGSHIKYL